MNLLIENLKWLILGYILCRLIWLAGMFILTSCDKWCRICGNKLIETPKDEFCDSCKISKKRDHSKIKD